MTTSSTTYCRAWPPKISPGSWKRSVVRKSGSATAVTGTEGCSTARITTSTTRYCRWVQAIGCGSRNRYCPRKLPQSANPDLQSSYPVGSGAGRFGLNGRDPLLDGDAGAVSEKLVSA